MTRVVCWEEQDAIDRAAQGNHVAVTLISIKAKLYPIHLRAPPPKGMKLLSKPDCPSSVSHLHHASIHRLSLKPIVHHQYSPFHHFMHDLVQSFFFFFFFFCFESTKTQVLETEEHQNPSSRDRRTKQNVFYQ